MNRQATQPGSEGLRVLLLGVYAAEREAVAHGLRKAKLTVSLRTLPSASAALSVMRSGSVQAFLCSLAAYTAMEEESRGQLRQGSPVPLLVLVSPGEELRAAALLERENTDVLLRLGNYPALLSAWVRRAVEQRQAFQDELGRIVRHEINNPLTGVLGNAELILAEPLVLPPSVRERLHTIVNLAVRMRDVVRTLEERLRPHQFPFYQASESRLAPVEPVAGEVRG